MPFAEEFDWLYEELQAAGRDASVNVERADDIFEAGIVIDQIKARIRGADIVIAVCTGRNANVFYELGIAESAHRPILIGEDKMDLPFDVLHFRAQFYGGDRRATLRERVVRSIRETLSERAGAPTAVPSHGSTDIERQTQRLREDLNDALQELKREEAEAIAKLDENLISRGVLDSSMRVDGRRRINSEYERRRERTIREWQRSVEDLGLSTPQPPAEYEE
jgi:hypothetical protein